MTDGILSWTAKKSTDKRLKSSIIYIMIANNRLTLQKKGIDFDSLLDV